MIDTKLLIERLSSSELQCYTVVRMALRDISRDNISAAMTRLSIDADKIRCHDRVLYDHIVEWRSANNNIQQ